MKRFTLITATLAILLGLLLVPTTAQMQRRLHPQPGVVLGSNCPLEISPQLAAVPTASSLAIQDNSSSGDIVGVRQNTTERLVLDATGANYIGTSAGTTATLGSELLTNGTFDSDLTGWTISDTGAGWSYAAGTAEHGTGNVETLSQNISVTNGTTYQVEFDVSGRTAGTFTVSIGAVSLINSGSGTTFTSTSDRTLVASGTGSQALTITPTSDFDGAIDNVTVRAITATITPVLALTDSSNNAVVEVRGDTSLYNLGIGTYSLYSNTTGSSNAAIGSSSLRSNTTGGSNAAIGNSSLRSNTTGSYNAAIGSSSLYSNTTGGSNAAIGSSSLYSNTTGGSNAAIGNSSLYSNTTGDFNAALGNGSLYSNTTGGYNAAIGSGSLGSNTTGSSNAAIGSSSLRSNTTGSSNAAIGTNGGRYTNGGSNNETSSSSTYLGYDTRASASGNSNETVIGAGSRGNGSNTATIGTTDVTTHVYGLVVGDAGTSNHSLTVDDAYMSADAEVDGTLYADGHFLPPTVTFSTNMNTDVAGTESELVYCSTDSKVYVCTTTGAAGSAVWAALN